MELNPETQQFLSRCFLLTLSPVPETRRSAEKWLSEATDLANYGLAVLRIVAAPSVDEQIRHAAAVNFKNHLRSRWLPSTDSGISPIIDSEKEQIKTLIVTLMLSSSPRIQSQLSEALALIYNHDFPNSWPAIISKLIPYLQETSHAGVSASVNERKEILPLDLIQNILAKISAKFIIRCRAMSKEICSRLGERSFIAQFNEHQKSKGVILRMEWDRQQRVWLYSSWDPKNDVSKEKKSQVVDQSPRSPEIVVTSDKGLLLIQNKNHNTLMVFNPAIRKTKILPDIHSWEWEEEMPISFSFIGFEHGSGVYKVLAVTGRFNRVLLEYKRGLVEFHIFTKGASTWKRLTDITASQSNPVSQASVCINGVIYYRGLANQVSVIVKFDLTRESFTFIQMPEELQGFGGGTSLILAEVNGELVIGPCIVLGDTMSLWTLKLASSSWSLTTFATAVRKGLESSFFVVFYKGATPCGQYIILDLCELASKRELKNFIAYFDTRNGTVERFLVEGNHHTDNNSEEYRFIWNYSESLVSL